MIEVQFCPVCNSSNWQPVFAVKDHSISGETFHLKSCSYCSLVVTSPRPDLTELPRYYQSENYISHTGKSNSIVAWAYLIARQYSLKRKLRLVNKLQPKGTVLDIGCGTGEFLSTLKNDGWKVSGLEPNTTAREKAETLIGQPIHETIDNASGMFNIITLWHVLEHLPNLDDSLQKIAKLLAPRGTLLVAVPNYRSPDATKYKAAWAGYDVPRHLWHFSQQTMVLLLRKHGFKMTQTLPMKLDAFYVSALSEKYKHGNSTISNLTNAFFAGLSSNRKAEQTGDFSSLIYIAER